MKRVKKANGNIPLLTQLETTPKSLKQFAELQHTWQGCSLCPDLCSSRINVVHCRGALPCDVFYLGEAPGEDEDWSGFPFVGRAGSLLDTLIDQSFTNLEGLPPRKVRAFHHKTQPYNYAIGNIIACVPWNPTNLIKGAGNKHRPPTLKEENNCRPRLLHLLEIAQPTLIVCLGSIAREAWVRLANTSTDEKTNDSNRQELTSLKKVLDRTQRVCYLRHPAFHLRQGGTDSAEFKRDLDTLTEFLKGHLK